MKSPEYSIETALIIPEMVGLWDGPTWSAVEVCHINVFRAESGSHRPITECKLLHDERGIYGIFKVRDNHMRCVHREFQADVWKDSCVEIFFEPQAGSGYFNFEFNCLGYLQSSYIMDPRKVHGKLLGCTPLTRREDDMIQRYHSIKDLGIQEGDVPQTWYLEFYIPFEIFENYLGALKAPTEWQGNIFKCGDETSHPHWASWAPLDELNFHTAEYFGLFRFK